MDIAMDPEVQWGLVRTLMVVPFWLFVFGRHCGPAEKHEAFELGYGLCPFHLLNFVRCPEKKSTSAGMGVRTDGEIELRNDYLGELPMACNICFYQ